MEETATGDPVAAFAEPAKVLPVYGTRAYMAAQEIRDKARWPHLDEHERLFARSRERIDRWDHTTARTTARTRGRQPPREAKPRPRPRPSSLPLSLPPRLRARADGRRTGAGLAVGGRGG